MNVLRKATKSAGRSDWDCLSVSIGMASIGANVLTRMKMTSWILTAVLILAAAIPGADARAFSGPDQPPDYAEQQWALRLIRAPRAWSTSRGAGITVAVLDTGIETEHPDLKGNIASAKSFIEEEPTATDRVGHGTHVAGIIAAEANGFGISGVAPEVRLMALKVCNATECSAIGVSKAIRFAVRNQAQVINLSFGANAVTGEATGWNQEVREAVLFAARRDVIVVAAAGNSSLPICHEPGGSAICVGGVDQDRNKTFYSNQDAAMRTTYLVAPSGADTPTCESSILSTFPRSIESVCSEPGYEARNGTSMAAPHVSGVAALLLAKGLSPAKTVRRLTHTASDLGTPGRDPVYGFGLINAAAAVRGVDR
jgi:subtilisin family serine protease